MDEIKLLLLKLRRVLYSRGQSGDDTDDLIQEAFLRDVVSMDIAV